MREFDLIRRYFAPLVTSPGAAGLSDDVAELAPATGVQVATTDTIVEGVHFLASDRLDTVAKKLVRVNVSDILAKGARPGEALLSLVWPRNRDEADIASFATGLAEDMATFGISLIGGDTTSTDGPLVASLTLLGTCLGDGPVRRSGGQAGDAIFVTGVIGAGWQGLRAAKGDIDAPEFLQAYRVPRLPALDASGLVARHASAAMDISDGLLGDLAKLAGASGCGARLDLGEVPFAVPCASQAHRLAMASGGDDYQILMSVPPESLDGIVSEALDAGISLTRIGDLVAGSGLELYEGGEPIDLPARLSFEHQG